MPTLAYIRVPKDTQDVTHQRIAILEFARHERLKEALAAARAAGKQLGGS